MCNKYANLDRIVRSYHASAAASHQPHQKMKRAVLNKHTPLSEDIIRKLPKAELHLHLDGSVRIGTIIELAEEQVPVDSCTLRLSSPDHSLFGVWPPGRGTAFDQLR